jgi:hypothetical protein
MILGGLTCLGAAVAATAASRAATLSSAVAPRPRPWVDGHNIRREGNRRLSHGTGFTAGGFQVPSMMEGLGGSTGQ